METRYDNARRIRAHQQDHRWDRGVDDHGFPVGSVLRISVSLPPLPALVAFLVCSGTGSCHFQRWNLRPSGFPGAEKILAVGNDVHTYRVVPELDPKRRGCDRPDAEGRCGRTGLSRRLFGGDSAHIRTRLIRESVSARRNFLN